MREGWKYKSVGECFPFIKNGANIKQYDNAEGLPITRIETLSGGVFNRDKFGYANIFCIDKYSDYILSSRDLLMSHINSKKYIGRTVEYIANDGEQIIHGMNLLRLKSNLSIIDSTFFAYYARCNEFKKQIIKIRKDAVNQSSFAISDLKSIIIPVPPIEEQQRIVTELDLLSSIIEKQKAQLKELDTLAQSIFYDMFGDPVTNEKGWNKDSICSFAKCVAGATPSTVIDKYWDNGTINWLSSGEVSRGRLYSTDKKISQLGYDSCSTILVPKHTVLIALAGQGKTRGTVGVAEIPLCTNQSICSLLSDDKIIVDFLYYQLKYLYNELRSISNGDGGRGGLNLRLIGSFKVIIPPISFQNQFADKIQSIESQKSAITKSITETQKLFDYTMDKYFG